MSDLAEALAWKFPGNPFSVNDETGQIQQWLGPDPQPDQAAIDQAVADFAAVKDEILSDRRATADLATPINKALRDLLLDIEQRLRAAGQTSTLPDIAAATNKAEYTGALKTIVKSYL